VCTRFVAPVSAVVLVVVVEIVQTAVVVAIMIQAAHAHTRTCLCRRSIDSLVARNGEDGFPPPPSRAAVKDLRLSRGVVGQGGTLLSSTL